MKYIPLVLILLCGCGNYVKKSTFDNYKALHGVEHCNINGGILFNEDRLDRLESHKNDYDIFKLQVEQDIRDLLPATSFILFVSTRNFQIDIGTHIRIIELK